jgi:hypothetical protein
MFKLTLPYGEEIFTNKMILDNTSNIMADATGFCKEFYSEFYKRLIEQGIDIKQPIKKDLDEKMFQLILQTACAEEMIFNFNIISSDT